MQLIRHHACFICIPLGTIINAFIALVTVPGLPMNDLLRGPQSIYEKGGIHPSGKMSGTLSW